MLKHLPLATFQSTLRPFPHLEQLLGRLSSRMPTPPPWMDPYHPRSRAQMRVWDLEFARWRAPARDEVPAEQSVPHGRFINSLRHAVERMPASAFHVNVRLCGVLTQLAMCPHPLVHTWMLGAGKKSKSNAKLRTYAGPGGGADPGANRRSEQAMPTTSSEETALGEATAVSEPTAADIEELAADVQIEPAYDDTQSTVLQIVGALLKQCADELGVSLGIPLSQAWTQLARASVAQRCAEVDARAGNVAALACARQGLPLHLKALEVLAAHMNAEEQRRQNLATAESRQRAWLRVCTVAVIEEWVKELLAAILAKNAFVELRVPGARDRGKMKAVMRTSRKRSPAGPKHGERRPHDQGPGSGADAAEQCLSNPNARALIANRQAVDDDHEGTQARTDEKKWIRSEQPELGSKLTAAQPAPLSARERENLFHLCREARYECQRALTLSLFLHSLINAPFALTDTRSLTPCFPRVCLCTPRE